MSTQQKTLLDIYHWKENEEIQQFLHAHLHAPPLPKKEKNQQHTLNLVLENTSPLNFTKKIFSTGLDLVYIIGKRLKKYHSFFVQTQNRKKK